MLCVQLAQIHDQRMEEILIAGLTEYGKDEHKKVQSIVENMLKQERWVRNILKRKDTTAQCPVWKRVAINVASNLNMSKLLEIALVDPSSAVRAVAIRHAFIYWRREREAGFELLEDLVNRTIGFWGLPIPKIFASSLGFSLLVLFYDFKNTNTITKLRRIWGRNIEQLLLINPGRLGGTSERIKSWVRTTLL